MRSFSKLGITLTSVFSLLFLALLAEILYLFWRRRQLLRRRRTRVEPDASILPTTTNHREPVAGDSSEILKVDGIYGPSRVLFTIKEEEREELETEERPSVGERKTGVVSLGEHFGDFLAGDSPEIVLIVGSMDFDVEPPFLTPCASPDYYTPSSSPARDLPEIGEIRRPAGKV